MQRHTGSWYIRLVILVLTIVALLCPLLPTASASVFYRFDVIAQTGKYKPNAPDLTGGNFVVEGEKRYWLHISLGRDLVKVDPILGTIPCQPGDTGCQVDVLGSQVEEVAE